MLVYRIPITYQEFLWPPRSRKISCNIVAPSSSRPDEEKEIADAIEFAAPVIDQSHYNN